MVRPCSVDENGMKKGVWSAEEDNKLRDYIQRYSHWNWRLLPKYAGLSRSGNSCRFRWMNYLRPGVKRGNFTKHEEELIIGLQSQIGNKWSAIAARLPGRTDNEIKNFWHSHIKKRKGKRSLRYSTNTVKASITIYDHQKYDDELGLGYDQMDNIALRNLESNSSYSIDEPEELEFWTDHSFPADKSYTQNQNRYFPPMAVPAEEVFDYPELHNNELSSSNSSYMSATATSLNWITDDDNTTIIISSDHHSGLDDQHNSQCDQIGFMLPQEVGGGDGGFYDHSFVHFGDGMLFDLY